MNGIYQEIRVALHMVWRRRWLALGIAWGVCLLGWLVIALIPNRYESRARVVVEMQSLLSGRVGMTEDDTQRNIDRVRQSLTSTENLIKVVRATELGHQATSDAEVAGIAAGLRDKVKIVAEPDNFFRISATVGFGGLSDGQNAKLAHDVVQKLIDLFAESNLAGGRVETAQSLKFLDGELQRREAGLRDAEAKRSMFEQRFLGTLPGSGSIADRMAATRSELMGLESNYAAAQSSLAAVNAQISSTPASVPMASVATGGGRLGQLEAQLSDALARGWTEKHPDVVALRSQIKRVRATDGGSGSASSVGASPNPIYLTLRSMQAERAATAAAIGARRAQLQGDIARMASLQISQPGFSEEQSRLSRNYEALKTQYDKLLADREDIRLRSDVSTRTDAIRFRVIDPPNLPRLPSAPERLLLMFVVLVAGLGAGVGTAFAMGQLRSTYATADRLSAATGMVVLGSIPQTLSAAQQVDRMRKLKLFAAGAAGLMGSLMLLVLIELVERGLMA